MEVVTGNNWSYKMCKLQTHHHHHGQTNTKFLSPANALPVTQPTVSEYWKEDALKEKQVWLSCEIIPPSAELFLPQRVLVQYFVVVP